MIYDAIIIGAGPAGLLMGSELSEKHKILVIEKNVAGKTNKSWTTEKKVIDKSEFRRFVSSGFSNTYFELFDEYKRCIKHPAVSISDEKLLRYLAAKIKKNRSSIIDKCEFQGIKSRLDGQISINTTKGEFCGRLLIDCEGPDSKLAKIYKIHDRVFYWPVYGEIYGQKLDARDIRLGKTIIKKFPINWFEVFPMGKNSFVCYTFQYLDHKIDPLKLRQTHRYHLRNSHLDYKKLKKPKKIVYGNIPMGDMKRQAADNIFFFGDTALLAGPLLGSGFTNLVQHYRKFAEHISKNISNGTLEEKYLNYQFSEKEKMNRELQVVLAVLVAKISPDDLVSFSRAIFDLPTKLYRNLFFLDLEPEELVIILKSLIRNLGPEKILKIIPKKEFSFVEKETIRIVQDILAEEAEKLFKIKKVSI